MRSRTDQFFKVLQALDNNRTYVPSLEINGSLVLSEAKTESAKQNQLSAIISEKEKDVIKQLCLGFTHAMIATNLGVSVQRVSSIRKSVFRKLGVTGVAQLRVIGYKNGLI
jgi:DNA-binding NarL/FixJ family response regulator